MAGGSESITEGPIGVGRCAEGAPDRGPAALNWTKQQPVAAIGYLDFMAPPGRQPIEFSRMAANSERS
jgi:hypothetical protein